MRTTQAYLLGERPSSAYIQFTRTHAMASQAKPWHQAVKANSASKSAEKGMPVLADDEKGCPQVHPYSVWHKWPY